ncbi:hypothetical protein PHYBOEH_010458 [Phytophthora boehmeriae]|uniref:Elicitin n=1 Tax=Phytophthora boehmeriae TaxID=109152 RepID=A0A8T1VQU1_9STRA|nr:hypothetical protein PHYBOEH_010458 [Phytophthora boehmeriae]
MSVPSSAAVRAIALVLLAVYIPTIVASVKCPDDISDHVQSKLDDATLFSTCSTGKADARFAVTSLFDVLDFSDQRFLMFCRSSSCVKPMQSLLHRIPTNCLIDYHGSARNLSEDVTTLYHKCAETTATADLADEEHLYRYFLD